MKKLVTSSEAAKILGLSLQGIHYRIKKGQLESVKKDGKTYVYVDSKSTTNTRLKNSISKNEDINGVLKVKDEQIVLLKKTVKFMKKQYNSEINRLEKTQDKMMNVFQSEIELLKSAFHEMKNIYHLEHNEHIEKKEHTSSSMEFMDIKDFFIFMKKHNKTESEVKQMILQCVKNGDKRFIYKKDSKEVIIYKSDFLDLI
ncbi:MAG: helix-turn-helix domain-containing protein [Campylobacterota bacterium]|nr:helix-turn-helix domain-containing protein [Campylobacterota bacterium]